MGSKSSTIHCPNCLERMLADARGISCAHCKLSLDDKCLTSPTGEQGFLLDHFRLQSHLGTGRFGDVWMAHDEWTNLKVALKLLRKDQLSAQGVTYFEREADVVQRLNHPCVIHIREVAKTKTHTYIVSDLVDGVTLSNWLATNRPDIRDATSLFISLAETVHFIHGSQIVHRDLKPSNIMVDPQGLPHVMDFGLAKCESDKDTVSAERYRHARYMLRKARNESEQVPLLGSPAYMSPEQATGKAYEADRRSDIFSLGVILYEMLTKKRPFQASSTDRLLRKITHSDPIRPRRVNGRVPKTLESICLKALSKDPIQRFPTAQMMAEKCQDVLHTMSDDAQRTSVFGRFTKRLWSTE